MVLDHHRATLRRGGGDGAILSGRFASGERLVEWTLCDQLGVSGSVAREVIRYLEAEGLVETLPNKGPMVACMSQICEAICSADPDASASAVRAHLNEAAEIARRILEREEAGKSD